MAMVSTRHGFRWTAAQRFRAGGPPPMDRDYAAVLAAAVTAFTKQLALDPEVWLRRMTVHAHPRDSGHVIVRVTADDGSFFGNDQTRVGVQRHDWPVRLAETIGRRLAGEAAMIARSDAIRSADGPDAVWAWSMHPVASSVLAASGMLTRITLPEEDDPTFLSRVPDGPLVREFRLSAEGGVLQLACATLYDRSGDPVIGMRTTRGRLTARLVNQLPDVVVQALAGRNPGAVTDVWETDPRARSTTIVKACNRGGGTTGRTEIVFGDELVPLDPTAGGGEPWRPTTASRPWPSPTADEGLLRILRAASMPMARLLGHSDRTSVLESYVRA